MTKDSCKPGKHCPFFLNYAEEHDESTDDLYCIGCIHLVRCPDLDKGRSRNDWELAWICEKDCMEPDVLYQDYEPVLPYYDD